MTEQSAFARMFSTPRAFAGSASSTRPNAATPHVQWQPIPDSTAGEMSEPSPHHPSSASYAMRAAAFSVHVFTAMGAGVALLALLEAVREHWAAMFAWLGVA